MKNTTLHHIPIFAILALTSLTAEVSGAIVFSGDVSAGTGQFAFDEAFEMTITTTGFTPAILVMNDFVTADLNATDVGFSPDIIFTLNDDPTPRSLGSTFVMDNYRFDLNDISFNDSIIALTYGSSLSAGDVLRFSAQSFSIETRTGFNPLLTGEFNGDFFLTDGNGIRISNNAVIIPEPSSGLLFGLGIMAIVSRRRRIQ